MENKKIKVLAIDDNLENLITFKALIMDVSSEALVLTASKGQEALDLAVAEDPDVIFINLTMPGLDGFEVCTRLKADKKLRDIPVVFINSLKGDKENQGKALDCGGEAFISKPIDEMELTALVRAMLKIKAANIQKREEKELLASMQLLETLKKEQKLIVAIFDSIQGYLYVYDESGKLIKWNKQHETMTGYTSEELSQMTLEKWFDEEDILKVRAAVQDIFEKGYGEVEAQLILKSGEKMLTRSSGAPLILDGHRYFVGIGVDITEQKRVQDALLESQDILKQNMEDLLESQRIAHLGTWRLNLGTNQVVWSEELYKMFGFDPSVPPPSFTEHMKLFTIESWSKLSKSIEETRKTGIPYELEVETVNDFGLNGWMWVRGEAIKDSGGNIVGLWGAAQDITAQKKVEGELLYLSYHDHLTGLFNRRFYEKELKRLDKKQYLPLSVIICDINGLKLVNDSFGHTSGDALLMKAGEVIKEACRENDIVARIGGDEFVVLLPNTSAYESVKVAERIKELASKEIVANIELSISCGYDTKTMVKQSMDEIIAKAENNMFKQKLYERSSLRSNTIDLIMNTLFEKSNREAEHSNRVGSICQAIAIKMDLDNDAVNQMKIAGLIHDIGKIGIDEKILNKTGCLTMDERKNMERHPEIGWRLLSSTNEFSDLAKFLFHHHEKWDGSGYPNGIKGEEIPLEARIISVADAYDAMTSERSYRKSLSKEEAIKELKRCSGTQFDPNIVNMFLDQVLVGLS